MALTEIDFYDHMRPQRMTLDNGISASTYRGKYEFSWRYVNVIGRSFPIFQLILFYPDTFYSSNSFFALQRNRTQLSLTLQSV